MVSDIKVHLRSHIRIFTDCCQLGALTFDTDCRLLIPFFKSLCKIGTNVFYCAEKEKWRLNIRKRELHYKAFITVYLGEQRWK